MKMIALRKLQIKSNVIMTNKLRNLSTKKWILKIKQI